MKKHLYFFVCLSYACCFSAHASHDYTLRTISTWDQLPVASIHTLMQDREGYMWYATRDGGLCRDDGYEMQVFRSDRNNPSLIGKSNYIYEVSEMSNNRIVFTNGDGLWVLDKSDYSIRPVDDGLREHTVEPLLVARDGTLWVSSGRILYHYSQDLKRIGAYGSFWHGQSVYPIRLTQTHDGALWASQWDGGIIRYDSIQDKWEEQYWPENITPTNIVEDPFDGSLWVGTWGKGIVRYRPTEQRVEWQEGTLGKDEAAAQVISMLRDPNRPRLFASTMYSLRAFDITPDGLAAVDLSDILPQGMGITDYLAFDRRGNLWVAGFPPHMFVLAPTDTRIHRHDFPELKHMLDNRLVVWNSVPEDHYLWMGLDRVLLCLYDTLTGQVCFARDAHIPNYLDMNGAKFRRCRTQKGIWSYAGHEVYHLWHEGMTIHAEHVTTAPDIVLSVYDDGLGNLYIGHLKGLECLDTRKGILNHLPTRSAMVKDIVRDQKGNLYYCSGNHHLVRMDSLYIEHFISDIGDFTSIDIAPNGDIWATDRQGDLLRYDPLSNTATVDDIGSSANGDYIRSMAIDEDGHLWLLTDKTVKDYNPTDSTYRVFAADDSEVNMDYLYNVYSENHCVHIDGAGAIIYLYTRQQAPINSFPSQIHLTSPTINHQSQITNHKSSPLTLSFSTLDHLHANRISYAYRLITDGDNQPFHSLPQGVNKATFSHLTKGTYTLQVMATDEYGRWMKPVDLAIIHQLPQWYETWWAILIYALISATILAAFIYYYIQYLKKKIKRQEVEKATLNSTDMQFINRAVSIVEQNIDNEDYNINLFASDLCMSRSTLYRRLTTLTGQKPTEFIRTIRLNHAAQLIREGKFSIAEVGFMCGFSSTSYFYRCFKQHFGVNPGDYLQMLTNSIK